MIGRAPEYDLAESLAPPTLTSKMVRGPTACFYIRNDVFRVVPRDSAWSKKLRRAISPSNVVAMVLAAARENGRGASAKRVAGVHTLCLSLVAGVFIRKTRTLILVQLST